jgi:hypothetical protein
MEQNAYCEAVWLIDTVAVMTVADHFDGLASNHLIVPETTF